jgi:hypothetical protein
MFSRRSQESFHSEDGGDIFLRNSALSRATRRRHIPCKKTTFFKRMASSGMLHSVALVRTDVSEELITSFIKVTRIGELGTTEKNSEILS